MSHSPPVGPPAALLAQALLKPHTPRCAFVVSKCVAVIDCFNELSICFVFLFLYSVMGFRERKEQTPLVGGHGLKEGGSLAWICLLLPRNSALPEELEVVFPKKSMLGSQVLGRLQGAQDLSG